MPKPLGMPAQSGGDADAGENEPAQLPLAAMPFPARAISVADQTRSPRSLPAPAAKKANPTAADQTQAIVPVTVPVPPKEPIRLALGRDAAEAPEQNKANGPGGANGAAPAIELPKPDVALQVNIRFGQTQSGIAAQHAIPAKSQATVPSATSAGASNPASPVFGAASEPLATATARTQPAQSGAPTATSESSSEEAKASAMAAPTTAVTGTNETIGDDEAATLAVGQGSQPEAASRHARQELTEQTVTAFGHAAPGPVPDGTSAIATQTTHSSDPVTIPTSPDAGNRVSAPAAPSSPPRPAAGAAEYLREPESKDAPATQPLRSVSLEFSPDNAGDVRLRLSERAGEVHISVHSTDPSVHGRLHEGINDLVGSLSTAGYDAKAWTPNPGRQNHQRQQDDTPQPRRKGTSEAGADDFSGFLQQPVQEVS